MLSTEKKAEFVTMRASGHSIARIAKELQISKDTCSKWDKELAESIAEQQSEAFTELLQQYKVGREHYIKNLGSMISRVDEAMSKQDLSKASPVALLRIRMELESRLQEISAGIPDSGIPVSGNGVISSDDVQRAMLDVYARLKAGVINKAQAKGEMEVLSGIVKQGEDSFSYF